MSRGEINGMTPMYQRDENVARNDKTFTVETKSKNMENLPIPEFKTIVENNSTRLQCISLLGYKQHGLGTLYLRIMNEKSFDLSYIPLGRIESKKVRDQISNEDDHEKFFFVVGQKASTYVISRMERTIFNKDIELIVNEPSFAKLFKVEKDKNEVKKIA